MKGPLEALLKELQRHAGWENTSGAVTAAQAIAALAGEAPIRALVDQLRRADSVDLTDDAGDVGDELWRVRTAVQAGLIACGPPVIPVLRESVHVEHREPRHLVIMRVLAELGDQSIAPILEAWSSELAEDRSSLRLAAVECIGLLKPANASRLLRTVLQHPGTINQGWLKRLSALALARVGDADALEVLLDDADWYARLGVAEALELLPPERAKVLRARALQDTDSRVRDAAR